MRLLAAAALALLAGCGGSGDPVAIDGSSPEAFERTTREARRELPYADRLVFDRALRTIGGRQHSARDAGQLARVTFDGMTTAEVVADQKSRDAGGQ